MQQDGVRDWCQYFHFEHSPAYQKIQLRFWEAVDTFDPNSIAVSNTQLTMHTYHFGEFQLDELRDWICNRTVTIYIVHCFWKFTTLNYDCFPLYSRMFVLQVLLTLFSLPPLPLTHTSGNTPRSSLPRWLSSANEWSLTARGGHPDGFWAHWLVLYIHNPFYCDDRVCTKYCWYFIVCFSERALCSFESSFHTLFNYTQANCRLDYSRAENRYIWQTCHDCLKSFGCAKIMSHAPFVYSRSFFLTLFRHLSYISRRGMYNVPYTVDTHYCCR